MKMLNILTALYCEPWLILPEMHARISEIVDAHISGIAHNPGGILDQFDADDLGHEEEEEEPDMVGSIAVMEFRGVITQRASLMEKSSGVTDLQMFNANLEALANDDDVSAIVLDIDSPGGRHPGVPETAQLVVDVSAVKPVVAFTDSVLASAAYYIVAGADAIIATGSATVGSIGTYAAFLDSSRAHEMAGLKPEVFQSGRFKGMGIPGTSLNEEQEAFLQERVDEIGAEFRAFVSGHREIPVDLMQGQFFSGTRLIDDFFVDDIGSLKDAITEARDLAEARP